MNSALCLLMIGCVSALALTASEAGAATSHLDLSYDIDSPAAGSANLLDLYAPDGITAKDSRPVVVYVHGGGWRIGDKKNSIQDKVNLFTGAGYAFASVNYRLSPAGGDPANPDPARIKFPAHPHDVGEAIGWLNRNVGEYGGDPSRIILIGHSAGAQIVSLVATDPSYVTDYGVEPWQVIGAISLDTDAFDITQQATQMDNAQNRDLVWNAFGTPAENARTSSWFEASATRWASPDDSELLLVTSANPRRLSQNRIMAEALGQDPAGIFVAPYDHEGINDAVGSPDDPAGETGAVTGFIARMIAAAAPPKLRLEDHPPERVRAAGKRAEIRFSFSSKTNGATFECRLDGAKFKRCKSPRKLSVEPGSHTFRVRAVSDRGRPGLTKVFRFRVRR